jgi:uncharacterized protein with PIN domain
LATTKTGFRADGRRHIGPGRILNDERERQAFIDLIANAATRLISAATRREPLLFKPEDFARTDLSGIAI